MAKPSAIEDASRRDAIAADMAWQSGYAAGRAARLDACKKCGSTDRWMHYRTCGHYYGGRALPDRLATPTRHRPEWLDDVPTGWCECGLSWPCTALANASADTDGSQDG
jgi:hypothetical protein